jgi:hypothetical protein
MENDYTAIIRRSDSITPVARFILGSCCEFATSRFARQLGGRSYSWFGMLVLNLPLAPALRGFQGGQIQPPGFRT